jgi:uncharacterized membrane protein
MSSIESKKTLCWVVLSGSLVSIAMGSSLIGFTMDLPNAGPHQAISCANVLIVAPFFYVFYSEFLTKWELLGCAVIIIGCIVMSDVLHWNGHRTSLQPFLWCFGAMVFFSLSEITLRFSSTSVLPRQLRMLVTMLSMGLTGAAMFLAMCKKGALMQYWQAPVLLFWPSFNAIAGSLGMTAVSMAFEAPGVPTGVLSAIVNGNSIVLTFLEWALLGYVPSTCKLVGSGLIMAGVILIGAANAVMSHRHCLVTSAKGARSKSIAGGGVPIGAAGSSEPGVPSPAGGGGDDGMPSVSRDS